jgi:hypothetical protein
LTFEVIAKITEQIRLTSPNKEGHSKLSSANALIPKLDALPKQFQEQAMNDIDECQRVLAYSPPLMLQRAVDTFWVLRKNTLPNCTISFVELKAYTEMIQIQLQPYEIQFLKELDYVYINVFAEESQR